MLVLTRKVGEQILIGDKIVIKICKISASRISIGIEAPKEIPVQKIDKKVEA